MSVSNRRNVIITAVLSLAVLVPGSFQSVSAAAQPPAAPPPAAGETAVRDGRRQAGRQQRAMPLNEALKALNLTPEQEKKIQEIRAQVRKDLSAISDRRSPDGQAKAREINQKQVADIKASLPAELQTKFQTAYDAAEAKNAEQARAQGAAAGLRNFKQPLAGLNLTSEQQAKIDPIVKASYDKTVELRRDRTVKRAERDAKLDSIIAEMKSQIRPILTTTQQTQLDALDLKPKAPQGRRNRAGARGNGNAAPGATGAKAPAAPAL